MKSFYSCIVVLYAFLLVAVSTGCSSNKEQVFANVTDVGDCKLPGITLYDASKGEYKLIGAGFNMWGERDAFHFAWKEVEGDFTLSADIAFEGEGVNAHRKLGLIIRENLDDDSRYADVAIHGDGLTSLQYREEKGGTSREVVSPNKAPNRILLERQGDRIIMKTATDKAPKEIDGEITMVLPAKYYVGLFICSHEDDVQEAAYFRNVQLK